MGLTASAKDIVTKKEGVLLQYTSIFFSFQFNFTKQRLIANNTLLIEVRLKLHTHKRFAGCGSDELGKLEIDTIDAIRVVQLFLSVFSKNLLCGAFRKTDYVCGVWTICSAKQLSLSSCWLIFHFIITFCIFRTMSDELGEGEGERCVRFSILFSFVIFSDLMRLSTTNVYPSRFCIN